MPEHNHEAEAHILLEIIYSLSFCVQRFHFHLFSPIFRSYLLNIYAFSNIFTEAFEVPFWQLGNFFPLLLCDFLCKLLKNQNNI